MSTSVSSQGSSANQNYAGLPTSTGSSTVPPPAPSSSNVQPTLKVMRLYKPRLYSNTSSSASVMSVPLTVADLIQQEFATSNMLILPDSFGEIFLGNTFSSYISVINQYTCDLKEVGLTANIQCANDRVDLQDNRYSRTGNQPPPNPAKVLAAGTSLDMVVDYLLSQVGNHVLRVGVTYLDPYTNEQKSLRKFYRFNVQNPLVISFKQLRSKEDSYVEAQIRNASKLPLYIDSVKFIAMNPFIAEEFQLTTETPENDTHNKENEWKQWLVRGTQSLLSPQEELQRVFKITTDPTGESINQIQTQASQNLGRLSVSWKTAMGEPGVIQSQPVMRKVEGYQEVTLSCLEVPTSVKLGEPFVGSFLIQSNSQRSMTLQLQFRKENMSGVFCSSMSYQNLGSLPPRGSKSIALEFLPTIGGMQQIRGAVLFDVRTGQEFFQDTLAHVLVKAPKVTSTALPRTPKSHTITLKSPPLSPQLISEASVEITASIVTQVSVSESSSVHSPSVPSIPPVVPTCVEAPIPTATEIPPNQTEALNTNFAAIQAPELSSIQSGYQTDSISVDAFQSNVSASSTDIDPCANSSMNGSNPFDSVSPSETSYHTPSDPFAIDVHPSSNVTGPFVAKASNDPLNSFGEEFSDISTDASDPATDLFGSLKTATMTNDPFASSNFTDIPTGVSAPSSVNPFNIPFGGESAPLDPFADVFGDSSTVESTSSTTIVTDPFVALGARSTSSSTTAPMDPFASGFDAAIPTGSAPISPMDDPFASDFTGLSLNSSVNESALNPFATPPPYGVSGQTEADPFDIECSNTNAGFNMANPFEATQGTDTATGSDNNFDSVFG